VASWRERAAAQGIAEAESEVAAARDLFEKAAAKGHSGAMFALGALFAGGHDLPADRQTAQRWFRAAAELGHGQAQLMLGRYLTNGLAGELDPEEGRLWLERAAAQGTAEAESEVAALTGNGASALDKLEDLARALRRSRMGSEQAWPAGERGNR
jgi:uncharacterized protein